MMRSLLLALDATLLHRCPPWGGGSDSSAPLVRVSPDIDLDASEQMDYMSSGACTGDGFAQPNCVRFDIADNSVVTPGKYSVLPEQLQRYEVGQCEAQDPPTRWAWQAGSVVWAKMGSQAEFKRIRECTTGWRNIVGRKPGKRAPFMLKSDDDDVRNGGAAPNRRDLVWLRSWPVIDERVVSASKDLQIDVTQAVSSTRVVLQPDKPWEVRMDNVFPTAYFDAEQNVTHLWCKMPNFSLLDLCTRGANLKNTRPLDNPFVNFSDIVPGISENDTDCWTPVAAAGPSMIHTGKYRRSNCTGPKPSNSRQAMLGQSTEQGLLYARSSDGIVFEKPALERVEWNGSKSNNIVQRHMRCATVMHDDSHMARINGKHFRLFGRLFDGSIGVEPGEYWWNPGSPGLSSSDDPTQFMPVQQSMAFANETAPLNYDTMNNLMWSDQLQKYIAFSRISPSPGDRAIGVSHSPDLRKWTHGQLVLNGSMRCTSCASCLFQCGKCVETCGPPYNAYSMVGFPWRTGFLGFVSIFGNPMCHGNWSLPSERCQTVKPLLAWSEDSLRWRILSEQPVIPLGHTLDAFDSHIIFPAAPIEPVQGTLQIYYGAGDGPHTQCGAPVLKPEHCRRGYVGVAHAVPDRWAGLTPSKPDSVTVTTHPLQIPAMTGPNILVGVSAVVGSSGGTIRVGVDGATALALSQSTPISSSGSAIPCAWANEIEAKRAWAALRARNDSIKLQLQLQGNVTVFLLGFLNNSANQSNLPAPANNLSVVSATVPFFQDMDVGRLLVFGLPTDHIGRWNLTAKSSGLLLGSVSSVSTSTDSGTDGEVPINISLRNLTTGPSVVEVTATCDDGARVLRATTSVTLARKADSSTIVLNSENGLGLFAGERSLPYVPFGAYIGDVSSEINRRFPMQEAPEGLNLAAPYISKEANHTVAEWAAIIAFLDNCSAVGLRVHYHLNSVAVMPDVPAKWSVLRTEILRVRSHPAIFGYYIADEPDAPLAPGGPPRVPPGDLEKTYRFIKQLDPLHPVTMVFTSTFSDPAAYRNAMDIGMMDLYPIVSLANDTATNQPRIAPMVISSATRLRATHKPFIMVLQCFGGGEAWQRSPTGAEMRLMAYLSLVHGAIGIQYFIRTSLKRMNGGVHRVVGADMMPRSPSAWNEVRRVSLEVAELAQAVAGGRQRRLWSNHINDNSTWVEAATWTAVTEPGVAYHVLLVVNCENTPTPFTISGLATTSGMYTGVAEVTGQNRNVSVVAGQVSDVLLGYGTAAYRFPPTNWSGGGLLHAANGIINPSFEYIASTGSPDGDYLTLPADPQDGGSFMADSRTSLDGAHSLRLIAPMSGGRSWAGGPFPSQVTQGIKYSLSVHAKAAKEGVVLDLRPSSVLNVSSNTTQFRLTKDWAKYEVICVGTTNTTESVSSYTLLTAGTAWIDMLDFHQSDA